MAETNTLHEFLVVSPNFQIITIFASQNLYVNMCIWRKFIEISRFLKFRYRRCLVWVSDNFIKKVADSIGTSFSFRLLLNIISWVISSSKISSIKSLLILDAQVRAMRFFIDSVQGISLSHEFSRLFVMFFGFSVSNSWDMFFSLSSDAILSFSNGGLMSSYLCYLVWLCNIDYVQLNLLNFEILWAWWLS